MTWLAVLLAAVGAVFFAVGARVQHEAVATAGAPRLPDLVRRPRWLAGLLLLGAGAGAHAVALGMAPVSVVQPVGVLAIGITALLDGRRRELPAVAVTTFGVGGFVVLAAGNATPTAVGPEAELVAGLIVLAIVTVTGIRSDRSTRGIRFGVAAGKPVVAADAMALPHLCHPGRNGWLFPPGDVDTLAHRLHAVIADPTAVARMGAASSDLITTHTIAATLDTFESLYAMAADIPAVAMKLPA